MKAYGERQEFYPDGYATMKGRPLKGNQIFLSERCATTNEGHWWVRTKAGRWEHITNKASTLLALVQNWVGGKGQNITAEVIEKFMKEDAPVVSGAMPVPTSEAPCIEFQGSRFINTWRDTFLPACPETLSDPALRPPLTLLMRVIREGLCGRDNELSLDEMIAAAQGDDPEELQFRFLMSFLAHPLQNPGANMQVNAWLLGRVQGIGRGTLTAEILPRLYGPHNVAILNAEEIERGGWSDRLEGKLVIIINELKARGDRAGFWNTFIKQHSTDPVVPIRKRNTHSHDALNFANWIFTSNNENPQCLDAGDRRNVLLATSTDEEKKALAEELRTWLDDHGGAEVDRLLGGFMHILLTHKVDLRLLKRAPDTMLKSDILETDSEDGEPLYWLRNSSRYPRDVWVSAADLLGDYIRLNPSAAQMSARTFGGVLSQLARHGHIERARRHATHAASYRISSEKFPVGSASGFGEKSGSSWPFSVVDGGLDEGTVPPS